MSFKTYNNAMIRQRKPILPTLNYQPDSVAVQNNHQKKNESNHEIHIIIAFASLVILGLIYGAVYLIFTTLPSPYTIADEKDYPDEFIAERAQNILRGLTAIGPRIVGSPANEILAVDYLNSEIDKIIRDAHPSFKITKDHQVTSGSYYLDFQPTGFVNAYSNVQNIIVKVDGRNTSESILINAHFDSRPISPGACDDGIMVAIMLEVLQKLTQVERQYERNLIFLFNGAEETILQAAHGFITQHKWAKTCKTIVNLESAGHGGRALLFQSGPDRSKALMSHYASVPYPFAQAAGEEIFQANLIPSDTDFRIFRDFGELSGFDIAFISSGYRYHTSYDSFDDLPLGSYQHGGGNALALIKSLATDTNKLTESDEKVVYYDFLNWFIITYSMLVTYIVNIVVSVASLLIAIISFKYLKLGLNITSLLYITYTTLAILCSWMLGLGVAVLIGVVLDGCNSTMSWYGTPFILFPLYALPIIGTFTLVMWAYNHFGPHKGKSLGVQSQIQMHLIRLIWTLLLFIGTLAKIRSVYVILPIVLFNTVASMIVLLARWQHSAKIWAIIVYIFSLIPVIFVMYLSVLIYMIFIPISGRSGAEKNPEILISAFTALNTLIIYSSYIHFHVLVKRQYLMPFILYVTFLITFVVVIVGGVFPYTDNRDAPKPERYMLFHTNRVYHQYNGDTFEDSGIFIHHNDRNSPLMLQNEIGVTDLQKLDDYCNMSPDCGMPIYEERMMGTVQGGEWKPFSKAVINEPVSMKKTTEILSPNIKRYHFVIGGPDHLTVHIRPYQGSRIVGSSLCELNTDEFVFINHVYGKTKANMEFTIDVQADNVNNPLMDVVVSGKYVRFDGAERRTKEYDDFVSMFPKWADVSAFVANYESYVM